MALAIWNLTVAWMRLFSQSFAHRMVGAPVYFCAQCLFVFGIGAIGQ